jgi:hypothetical protein
VDLIDTVDLYCGSDCCRSHLDTIDLNLDAVDLHLDTIDLNCNAEDVHLDTIDLNCV